MNTDTCIFDSELLKQDMDKAGHKLSSLSRAGEGHFSLPTLKRALSGKKKIQIVKAQAIALALGQPEDRYILSDSNVPARGARLALSGTWHAFFVHDPRGKGPTMVREILHVRQSGPRVTGVYDREADDIGENFEMKGEVEDKIVVGSYRVPGREGTVGMGYFHLSSREFGDWMEGYCTWVDSERSDEVAFSKNIWIKASCIHYAEYLSTVTKIMEIEKKILSFRREKEQY